MSDDMQRMRATIDARKNQWAAAEKQKLETKKKAKPQAHENGQRGVNHVWNRLPFAAVRKMLRLK